jgi:putative transposase
MISICLDKGYDYDEVRELGKEFGYTLHIRPRNEEAQAIKRQVGYKARRWVVERPHESLSYLSPNQFAEEHQLQTLPYLPLF